MWAGGSCIAHREVGRLELLVELPLQGFQVLAGRFDPAFLPVGLGDVKLQVPPVFDIVCQKSI